MTSTNPYSDLCNLVTILFFFSQEAVTERLQYLFNKGFNNLVFREFHIYSMYIPTENGQ